MKIGKTPGPDHITVEMPSCLTEEHLPMSLANSVISLLLQKGDPMDVQNFRPVALLSTVYKLFSSTLRQYSKAFDSVEQDVIWNSLLCQGIHPKIVRLLSNIYAEAEVAINICGKPALSKCGEALDKKTLRRPLSLLLFSKPSFAVWNGVKKE
ncbi:hypothetical protein ANCDUO_11014 [Ancylostoma duodenale]|uniref:Reverse transcriptase domain-containing protein n=1 Tax=Ancylostoma duodenale TaxID=51022 RepID=A0A0C2D9A6_9BILA|nr:hypothetical protein ANCDUO_11014 [Ancylostoma duodenale]